MRRALQISIILSVLLITSFLVSNLIFQQLSSWNFLEIHSIGASVKFWSYGIINCIYTSLFSSGSILVAGIFSNSLSLLNTMALVATAFIFIDLMRSYFPVNNLAILLFQFWKKFTHAMQLWSEKNLSTLVSAFINTVSVLFLLSILPKTSWGISGCLLLSLFLIKVPAAAVHYALIMQKVKKNITLSRVGSHSTT